MSITNSTFLYLQDLKNNNTREWFSTNRKRYDVVKSDFEEIIKELIGSIGEFENMTGVEVKHCNYRIARDVRFTHDKAPYKSWLSASFSEGGRKSGRVDYYLHISENESFLGGGMWAATPEQLAKFRQEIDYNAQEFKAIIYALMLLSFRHKLKRSKHISMVSNSDCRHIISFRFGKKGRNFGSSIKKRILGMTV